MTTAAASAVSQDTVMNLSGGAEGDMAKDIQATASEAVAAAAAFKSYSIDSILGLRSAPPSTTAVLRSHAGTLFLRNQFYTDYQYLNCPFLRPPPHTSPPSPELAAGSSGQVSRPLTDGGGGCIALDGGRGGRSRLLSPKV